MAPTRYERRAERFAPRGYVVAFADYLGRRGLKSCAGSITHEEAARDVVSAAAWLRSQAAVDPARITADGMVVRRPGRARGPGQEHDRASWGSRAPLSTIRIAGALPPWKTTLNVLMLPRWRRRHDPATLCQDAVKRVATPGRGEDRGVSRGPAWLRRARASREDEVGFAHHWLPSRGSGLRGQRSSVTEPDDEGACLDREAWGVRC